MVLRYGKMKVFSEGRGLSPITAATVLSTLSGTSVAGRLVMGAVSDWIGRKRALVGCLCTEGIIFFWLIGASSAWMLFLFGALFGFAYGGHVHLGSPIVAELFGLSSHGVILWAVCL